MLEIIRFRRSSSFTMDAFTHMLESQMSVAQIGCGFPDHLRCVRPNIVEVAMITCSDRLEVSALSVGFNIENRHVSGINCGGDADMRQ
jgi:hypothetical protein